MNMMTSTLEFIQYFLIPFFLGEGSINPHGSTKGIEKVLFKEEWAVIRVRLYLCK